MTLLAQFSDGALVALAGIVLLHAAGSLRWARRVDVDLALLKDAVRRIEERLG